MKEKINETLILHEALLQEVMKLQQTEINKLILKELDKDEIELKSQISILRYLLSE